MRIACRCLLLFVVTCWLGGAVVAAPPQLKYFFPAGAARDTTTGIAATGSFSTWPVQVWTDQPGISLLPEADKGKWQLTVSADTAAGIHWLRCFNDEGASSPVPFLVGTLAEVTEIEPNDDPAKAQRLDNPVTVNGRLAKNGDVDAYLLELQAGQTLVASIQAHNDLRSPMDAVLQLCWVKRDAKDPAASDDLEAFVIDQVDDSVGLDPRLVTTIPRAGTYLVRVFAFPEEPNSTIGFAGGDEFIYRLTLTTGGFIDHARPLAIPRNVAVDIELCGWNIPEESRMVQLTGPADRDTCLLFRPSLASWTEVALVDHPVVVSFGDKPIAGRLQIPVTVTGRLEQPRQRDTYLMQAEKGKKLSLRVASRSLGFATDPELIVSDTSGKSLSQNDDSNSRRDPELNFTVPDTGEYQISVRDVHGHGNFRNVYRLTVTESAPDYALALAADSVVITAGKTLEIPVTIDRRDGYAEPIELTVDGLPGGVTAVPVTSSKDGATAKSVQLVLMADAAAERFHGPVMVRGTSTNAAPVLRTATYSLKPRNVVRNDLFLTVMK